MKSNKLWGAVPLVLIAFVACGGESLIGKGDETSTGKAGSTASAAGAAATSSGGTDGKGSGNLVQTGGMGEGATSGGGKPTPGTGATSGAGSCLRDDECFSRQCQMCPDGQMSCGKSYCVEGRCVVEDVAPCAPKCSSDMECTDRAPLGCIDCGDGLESCPKGACVQGFCQFDYQGGCKNTGCAGLACGDPCNPCGGGGFCDVGMGKTYCNREGKCLPEEPSCAGGSACETSMDCGTAPPSCVGCADGSCAAFECIEHKCVFACPANPTPQCKVSEDCPGLDEPCTMCSSGKCAVQACLQGSCALVCPVP